jgi:pimeloyl-ACP methyl ester carboxylesterase
MTSPASSATVVLVHGAFADSSSWSRVVSRLDAAGVAAVAPPNPLRGLTADGEYIASVVSQIDGPVLLVGHSYAAR